MSAQGENGAVAEEAGLSVLADLRRQHAKEKRETTKLIPIPGSEWLVAEYQVIEWERERELELRVAKAGDHERRELNFYIDQLIAACKQLHVDQGEGPKPLDPDRPIRYDERLARGLELDVDEEHPRARDVLYAVFDMGQENSKKTPYVISAHHTQFSAWMAGDEGEGAAASVEAGFLGE